MFYSLWLIKFFLPWNKKHKTNLFSLHGNNKEADSTEDHSFLRPSQQNTKTFFHKQITSAA